MKNCLLLAMLTFPGFWAFTQAPALDIRGEIKIGSNNSSDPSPGTIRWTGADFEGWNGVIWVSLTGGKSVGKVTDADGNNYNTIRIGEQDWMTENLRVTLFEDKTSILEANNAGDWEKRNDNSVPAYCWPNGNAANISAYGLLYNGYVIDQVVNHGKDICPASWRLPTDADIDQLRTYLGGPTVAGNRMREAGTMYWALPNSEADNRSGYSGRGTGYRFSDQIFYSFKDINFNWLSDADNMSFKSFSLRYDDGTLNILTATIGSGHSIRCIKE